MPYISKASKDWMTNAGFIDFINRLDVISIGELNFIITTLLNHYILQEGENYATYNEVIGVLECVKQELYRRRVAPYEDEKIKENGDVF